MNPREPLLSEAPAPPGAPTHEITPVCTNEFSRWADAMSQGMLSLHAENLQARDDFYGHATIARFHRCVVADIRASAHRVMRTRSLVAADDSRYFKVMWQVNGTNRIEHGRDSLTIEPGQWAIYDTAQPYTIDTSSGSRFLVLLLPLSEMGRWESGIDFIAGKVLPTRGTSEIARSALSGMLSGGVELDREGAMVMQDSISALVGTAAAQIYGQSAGEEGAASRKLRKAQRYIEDHLTEPDLSPDGVALACGMSRRSLYTAFNAIAQTPNHYILQRRLALAANQLAEPRLQVTITQLAFELGFSDPAHFSRVFSERYGHSPSAWRNQQIAEQR